MPAQTGSVEASGCTVRYLQWGDGPGPATILVHGGGAHAHWWAPLAPDLAAHAPGPVVAIDLSGHGVSGSRDSYHSSGWVEEVDAVIDAFTRHGPSTVVGHSMGGIIAATHALDADSVAHVICVDAPLWPDPPVPDVAVPSRRGGSVRHYASPEEAIARLRLIPPQECATQYYPAYVAWHGLRRDCEGWRWRVDPAVFAAGIAGSVQMARFPGVVDDLRCRVSMLAGSRSYLLPAAMESLAPRRAAEVVVVPGAGHHVMLDAPEALLAALTPLLPAAPPEKCAERTSGVDSPNGSNQS